MFYHLLWIVSVLTHTHTHTHTHSPIPLAILSLLFCKRNKEWWINKNNNLTLQKKTQPINYSFKPTSSIATVTSLWETAVVSFPAHPPLPSTSFREQKEECYWLIQMRRNITCSSFIFIWIITFILYYTQCCASYFQTVIH